MPTAIPVMVLPETTPVEAVTTPLLLKLTSYVVPLHIAPETVKFGAVAFGEFNVTISGLHPLAVAVRVTSVPTGMLDIAVGVIVPADAAIVAAFGLLIETL